MPKQSGSLQPPQQGADYLIERLAVSNREPQSRCRKLLVEFPTDRLITK